MNKERMKILHVSKATGIAGSENHLLSLLPRLDRSRYEVTFTILTEPDKPLDDYLQMFEEKGIKTKRLIIRRDVDPKCLWDMYLFIRKNRFYIVHTHLIHADLYGTLAAKLAGVKFVLSTKHGYDSYKNISRFYRLNQIFSPFVQKIITISEALKEHCSKVEGISKEKMITIYYALKDNYVNNSELKNYIRDQLKLREDIFLIAIAGRLIEVKGHKYLFEALVHVKKKFNDFRLLV